jgi:hypothetical protein
MDGHNLSAVRAAMRHFHSDIFQKNIIPRRLTLDWGAGTDSGIRPGSKRQACHLAAMAAFAEEFRRSLSNPDANRLRMRLLRL